MFINEREKQKKFLSSLNNIESDFTNQFKIVPIKFQSKNFIT